MDARSRRTYDAGHIPGAINLTKLRFNEDFRVNEAAIRAAQQIVVYCASRNCEESSIVATMLEQKGFRNILIFEGGWDEW